MDDFEKRLKQAFHQEAARSTPACIPLNTLGMYAENKLSGNESKKVQTHLSSCAHCMKRLIELRNLLLISKQAEAELDSLQSPRPLGEVGAPKFLLGREGFLWKRVYEWLRLSTVRYPRVFAFAIAILVLAIGGEIGLFSPKSEIPDYLVKLQALNAQGSVINTGLGLVTNPDGVIVTKLADVAGAASVKVEVGNKTYHGDQVVGIDRVHGFVSLKVNAKDLPSALFSKSTGEQKVIAISKSFETSEGFLKTVKAVRITSSQKETDLLEVTISRPGDYTSCSTTRAGSWACPPCPEITVILHLNQRSYRTSR